MRVRGIAWYEARVVFGASAVLPALIPPLFALFQWFVWTQRTAPATAWELVRAFELTPGLAAGLSAAHLMAVERQERFAELRHTYPEPRWLLPLLRTAGAATLMLPPLLLAMLNFWLGYGPYDLVDTVLPSLAPAVFLLGLGLLLGNLTGNYWVAAGGVLACWFFEWLTMGDVTRLLFLFNRAYPVSGVSEGLNRALLVGIGVGMLAVNGYLAARRAWHVGIERRRGRWPGHVIG